jgi:hypothetical protein
MEMEVSTKSQSGTDTLHPAEVGSPEPQATIEYSDLEFEDSYAEIRAYLESVRPRVRAHEYRKRQIKRRAIKALRLITSAIRSHPGTGQTRRLVRFVGGCYNGSDYPFDLTELRGLDAGLASACLDYLDYDRLAIREIHEHLPEGARTLHQWLRDYDIHATAQGCR